MADIDRPDRRPGPFWRGYALLLILVGLVFVGGGGWLTLLGGSPYYLLAGLLAALSGWRAWQDERQGQGPYAALMLGTLAWAAWEAGLDGWALVPRLLGPAVLGAGFLFTCRSPGRMGALGLAAFALGLAGHAWFSPTRSDPMFQAGTASAFPASFAPTSPPASPLAAAPGDWRNYGNDEGGSRYSPLDQLTPANVAELQKVWEVHVGDAPMGRTNGLQATPLKVGASLYTCTGYNDVLSIDAETGRVNWRFHAGIDMRGRPHGTCRGVGYFAMAASDAPDAPAVGGLCAERIITNTTDARLIALDARTGQPCPGFGQGGTTDLNRGMGRPDLGYYYVSSAPTLVNGRIVLGGWVSDGQYWGEPSGVIRAYDAVTGRFAWAFDVGRPDRRDEPAGNDTYTRATPNAWAPMSADPALGLVYVPTGNATPDYYGAQRRPFDDRYSSAVVAIDVATGDPRWVFQTTHHDLWDYDVASQPTLVDIPEGRAMRKALVQPTKRGEIFLLDRVTGKPIATVAERRVPQAGAAPGERLSPTQPFSIGMPSFSGADWEERDMWGMTAFDQLWCRIQYRRARYQGTMTPPGLTPWIGFPGYLGGVDWGSASVDPTHAILIVNSSRVGNYNVLIPRAKADAKGVVPSRNGSPRAIDSTVAQGNTPYAAQATPFLSPLGVPCNKPPYGLISAVDLRTRKLLWSHPLGTAEDSGPLGLRSYLPVPMGLPNAGGSVTTAGGLVFIAATQAPYLSALSLRDGREIWRTRLPAGGQATPMTYRSDRSGRQFVVISAGGNAALRSPRGDSIVAYALPHAP